MFSQQRDNNIKVNKDYISNMKDKLKDIDIYTKDYSEYDK